MSGGEPVPLDALPPDPFPAAVSDHARAQALTAATIARQLQAAIPDCDTQAAVYAQLVRATTEVAEYFGLNPEDI